MVVYSKSGSRSSLIIEVGSFQVDLIGGDGKVSYCDRYCFLVSVVGIIVGDKKKEGFVIFGGDGFNPSALAGEGEAIGRKLV